MRCEVCGTAVKPGKLMCDPHWAMLPLKAQLEVFEEWAKPPGAGTLGKIMQRAVRFVRRELAEAPQRTS
jgi:hypothetical protein